MSIPSVGPTWYSHWAGITSALVPDTLTEIHFKNASRQPLPITNTATHYLCLVPQHTCHFRHNCGNNGYKQSLDKCLKDLQGLKETNATTTNFNEASSIACTNIPILYFCDLWLDYLMPAYKQAL